MILEPYQKFGQKNDPISSRETQHGAELPEKLKKEPK